MDAVEEALGFSPIEQIGDEDRGHCILPWGLHKHGDSTGKLYINREKKVYMCWVCSGGGLLDLVMAVEDLDEDGALNWLHQFVVQDDNFLERIKRGMREPEPEKPKVLPIYNKKLLDKWDYDHPWFEERGISEKICDRFSLRYCPETRRVHKDEEFIGETIILPHFWQGRLVGWQSRWLSNDRPKWVPKYTNTRDFPRAETLWGYDANIDKAKPIIVESVPTALYLISNGYPSIATFGSNVNDARWKLLRVFQDGIYLAPDNDDPGYKFMQEGIAALKRYIPVDVIPPPDGEEGADLGDLVNDSEPLRNYLERYGIHKAS